MNNNVDLISFKGNLLKNQTITEIKQIIISKLTGLDMVKVKRDLLELTKQILRYLKELCCQKSLKLETSEIETTVIEIIAGLANLTATETELVRNGVQFLLSNKLIKRSSLYKRAKRLVCNVLKKT